MTNRQVLSYGFEVRDRLLAAETSPRSAPDKRRVMGQERCSLMASIQAYQRGHIDREQLERSINEAIRVMGLWRGVSATGHHPKGDTQMTKLVDWANEYAAGGIVTNDRGNGSGGTHYIAEGTRLPRVEVTIVSPEDDADAWRLAREAFQALGIESPVYAVAVGITASGEANPHQVIYAC